MLVFARSLLTAVFVTVILATPGLARASDGLYVGVGLGYGSFSGDSLITTKIPGSNDLPMQGSNCCPNGGLALDLRVGYSLFGVVAPEFAFTGDGWNLGSNTGGSGFIGGGLRLFPLGLAGVMADTNFSDFPIDISIAADYGYTIVGKDFAYTGSWIGFDGTVEYKLSPTVSLAFKLAYFVPSYADFVYTDYNNNVGRCLDGNGTQIGLDQPGQPELKKNDAVCNGKGPAASFLSPTISAIFHFTLFE
jgi:hypothetical protein